MPPVQKTPSVNSSSNLQTPLPDRRARSQHSSPERLVDPHLQPVRTSQRPRSEEARRPTGTAPARTAPAATDSSAAGPAGMGVLGPLRVTPENVLDQAVLAPLLGGDAEAAERLAGAMRDWTDHRQQTQDEPAPESAPTLREWYSGAALLLIARTIDRVKEQEEQRTARIKSPEAQGETPAQAAIEALQSHYERVTAEAQELKDLEHAAAQKRLEQEIEEVQLTSPQEGPVDASGADLERGHPRNPESFTRRWLGWTDAYMQGSGYDDKHALAQLRAPKAEGEPGLASSMLGDIQNYKQRLNEINPAGQKPLPAKEVQKLLNSLERTVSGLEKDSNWAQKSGMLGLGLGILAFMQYVPVESREAKWVVEQAGMVEKYGVRLGQVALSQIGANKDSFLDFLRYYLSVPATHVIPYAASSSTAENREKLNKNSGYNFAMNTVLFAFATGIYNPHRFNPILNLGRAGMVKMKVMDPKPADTAWRSDNGLSDVVKDSMVELLDEIRQWADVKGGELSKIKSDFDPTVSGNTLQMSSNLGGQFSKAIDGFEALTDKVYDLLGETKPPVEQPVYEGQAEKDTMWWTAFGMSATVTALMPPDLVPTFGNAFEAVSSLEYTYREGKNKKSVSVDQMRGLMSSFFSMTTGMFWLLLLDKGLKDPMAKASAYLEDPDDPHNQGGRNALIAGNALMTFMNLVIANKLSDYTALAAATGAKKAKPYVAPIVTPPANWVKAQGAKGVNWSKKVLLSLNQMRSMNSAELVQYGNNVQEEYVMNMQRLARYAQQQQSTTQAESSAEGARRNANA